MSTIKRLLEKNYVKQRASQVLYNINMQYFNVSKTKKVVQRRYKLQNNDESKWFRKAWSSSFALLLYPSSRGHHSLSVPGKSGETASHRVGRRRRRGPFLKHHVRLPLLSFLPAVVGQNPNRRLHTYRVRHDILIFAVLRREPA